MLNVNVKTVQQLIAQNVIQVLVFVLNVRLIIILNPQLEIVSP